ncbi:MAG: SUMF1/EgtB/PvdO family nonheme iron enzyme [Candidatus Delongbacteria bacterium]|nr:SUMF1/EgtB/PvdO family nonheme iron enzyme [Candidatus Delongbacteria bacterium]
MRGKTRLNGLALILFLVMLLGCFCSRDGEGKGNPELEPGWDSIDFGVKIPYTTLTIRNSGDGLLTWKLSEYADWLEVVPDSGAIRNDQFAYIRLNADRKGLEVGRHVTRIYFRYGQGKVKTIPVQLDFDPLEIEMAEVEGGTFVMGKTWPGGEYYNGDLPHNVTLRGYLLGKFEITQQQWHAVAYYHPAMPFQGDDLPAMISEWKLVADYCNCLSIRNGLTPYYSIGNDYVRCNANADGYRLPTEAEWEYAARGGKLSRGYHYSGGDDPGQVAWYSANSDGKPHPVGTKLPNELGIFDMSGNVNEWCHDWYQSFTFDPQQDPVGPSLGKYRIVRGGGWEADSGRFFVHHRGILFTYHEKDKCGFRVARNLPE